MEILIRNSGVLMKNEEYSKKFTKPNLRTNAKPPLKFSPNRHNPILSETPFFGGGLTLTPR